MPNDSDGVPPPPGPDGEPTLHLQVIGGPVLRIDGVPVAIPEGSKRLLVLVALRQRRCARSAAARLLWPEVATKRAAGNLRSAIWRIRCAGADPFGDDPHCLSYDHRVAIDLEELLERARDPGATMAPEIAEALLPRAIAALDLLPGWYDDWLVPERERIRAPLWRAIESMTLVLARSGRCADAIEAALSLVADEPLREGAQVALITAHLREANVCEARRSFLAYARMLHDELGVTPSERVLTLMGAPARRLTQAVVTGRRSMPSPSLRGSPPRPGSRVPAR